MNSALVYFLISFGCFIVDRDLEDEEEEDDEEERGICDCDEATTARLLLRPVWSRTV